jgi:hypothetical protein
MNRFGKATGPPMQQEPDFLQNLHKELKDGRRWLDRGIVLAYAVAAGLAWWRSR